MRQTSPSIAELYHALTKYTPESVRRPHAVDWHNPPVPFKTYTTGTEIDLARYLPLAERPLTPEARTLALTMTDADRSVAQLAHLFYLANGVTAVIPYPERNLLMRAAPSAGGLYPTELYLVTRDYPGLEDGLYNLAVRDHALVGFWPGSHMETLRQACFDHPALVDADVAIIASGVFHRSAWRYLDRAYRRILLDTGHVLGNIELAAPYFNRRAIPIGGFRDAVLNELCFFDESEEAALAVLALAPLSADYQAIAHPTALPSAIAHGPAPGPEGTRLLALHAASSIRDVPADPALPVLDEPRYRFTFGEALQGPLLDWEDGVGDAIVMRRSTRTYTGGAIPREALGSLLDFTYRSDLYEDPRVDTGALSFDASLLQTYVSVQNVEGLDPGCYHYAPDRRELRQIRFKNLSEEVQYLCLGQDLGGMASAVVFHTADLPKSVERYGDRAYRYLHLDAGRLGQRLNVACMHMGLGVSGIGGFFDDEVNAMLGIPEDQAVVYITTIGRPAPLLPK